VEAQKKHKQQHQQHQQHQQEAPAKLHPEEESTELLFEGAVLRDREGKVVQDPMKALRGRAVGLLFGGMWWCVGLRLALCIMEGRGH
jgi:hypothetical protein